MKKRASAKQNDRRLIDEENERRLEALFMRAIGVEIGGFKIEYRGRNLAGERLFRVVKV